MPAVNDEEYTSVIFSSYQYMMIFLPIVFFGYFALNKMRFVLAGKAWLVAASLFFYAFWNIAYLPLLLVSIGFNFMSGRCLSPTYDKPLLCSKRQLLALSITMNLLLLAFFKYMNFFVDNMNIVFETGFVLPDILLPLGISFFTFTQIAYLVDSYRNEAKEYNLTNYALFVTFFPHLIAGPILHHREMMSQFESRWTWTVRYRNIFLGLFIFSIGLFKKVILADTFAIWATQGFDNPATLDFFSAWGTSLSYTMQLYFDFSGYCDMAIGSALLFNIWLPINFNSPYKSLDIQDFWRRWHITLSRFLRDYLYIPLGGNRCSTPRMYVNLFATFVLGGLWHGASWMFVIWGALHGGALVIHRVWTRFGLEMPKPIAWFVTFQFVNIAWVFFRANTFNDAKRILSGMVDIASIHVPLSAIPTRDLAWAGWLADDLLRWLPTGLVANILCYCMIAFGFIILCQKNSFEWMSEKHTPTKLYVGVLLFCTSVYATLMSATTVFLYFNF
jgi:D-alanyl-lipoteichoic acid acyltransferase DltB (MBOAT superfamily)